jgi:Zn-dependent protease/predicted transcriptional regulator
MSGSFKLARLFGIDVRIHVTWFVALGLITWALATGYFRFLVPRQQFVTAIELAALSAVLLFVSVLVHEFSHSVVARALGMQVRDITLFIFGGVSNIRGEARTPRDEALVSAVGPLTSFGIAGVFWLIGQWMGPLPNLISLASPRFLASFSPVAAVLGYLVMVNVLLGAFNLIPAYPLDGGRVLRSALWWLTGFNRATTVAVRIGQGFGLLMVAFGLWRVVVGDIGGLWTALIGWFLTQAAGASLREQSLRASLQGVLMGQLMDPSPPVVDARASVDDVVHQHMLRIRQPYVIVTESGQLRGVVRSRDIKRLARDAWASVPVGQIAQQPTLVVTPETDVCEVLERIDQSSDVVPVVADGEVVGVVRPHEIMRYAQLQRELRIAAPKPAGASNM